MIRPMLVRFFSALGRPPIRFVKYLGEIVMLGGDTFRSLFTHRLRWKLFLNQVVEIGLLSQLVVVITGGFTGAVFSAQTYFQFHKLGMGSAVGAVVSVALMRELGPVLTALMVTGRVGAAMSAEIGTMKVTEQIDALRALAVYSRACDDGFDAVARCGMHRGWNRRWLPGRHLFAGDKWHLLHGQHGEVDAEPRHHHGSVEGVLFRHSHCLHQLPQRIDRTRRCGRRRPGHHRSRR